MRRYERTLALAGAGVLALSLAACGSNNNGSSPPTSITVTTPPTTTPGSPTTTSNVTRQADALCSQIKTAVGTLDNAVSGHVNTSKLTQVFLTLSSDSDALGHAARSNGMSTRVNPVLNDVGNALSAGRSAASASAKGNTNALQTDIDNMRSDLHQARVSAANGHLGDCTAPGTPGGAPASTSPTTS